MNFSSQDIERLIEVLPTNKTNAIHAKVIAQMLGFPLSGNQVKTRSLIRVAIKSGHIILSSTVVGYWISTNSDEVSTYVSSLRERGEDTILRSSELEYNWNHKFPLNRI